MTEALSAGAQAEAEAPTLSAGSERDPQDSLAATAAKDQRESVPWNITSGLSNVRHTVSDNEEK